jgi:subtilisin family serine protease
MDRRTAALVGGLMIALAACSDAAPTPVLPSTPRATESDGALEAPIPEEAPIANQWIVAFRRGVSAEGKAAALGVSPDHVYVSIFNGFAGYLSGTQLATLRNDSDVDFLEQDRGLTAAADQSDAPWNLDRLDWRDLPLDGNYTYTTTASGVRVYVIDSGIAFDHGELAGRVFKGYDGVPGGLNGEDCSGHGTHVAGTVGGTTYGVAKQVRLVSVRVLNCNNAGTVARLLAGMEWVATHRNRPAVANIAMSVRGYSPALNAATTRLYNRGVVVVAAAGNFGDDACKYFPAGSPRTFTVAATTRDDARWPGSNHGPCVEMFAPGADIRSAWNTATAATAVRSGTSSASALASGVAALYLQEHPDATPDSVYAALIRSSTPNRVSNPGAGTPNRLLTALLPPLEITAGVSCLRTSPESSRLTCTAGASGGSNRFTFRWHDGSVDGPGKTSSFGSAYCLPGAISTSASVVVTDDLLGVEGSAFTITFC